jgi:NAD(P)-dependent dehydrogenase (short-subunit alcohol dehydrogenase family)
MWLSPAAPERSAVVGALLREGAVCHVPSLDASAAQRFPYRDDARVKLTANIDLVDENAVTRFFTGIKQLWASIHIAGGFAMGPLVDTGKAALMTQLDMNLVSCFLCCRAAVQAMKPVRDGRIVNVAARPALEPRLGAGMTAYTVSKAGVAALTQALAEEVAEDGILVNAVVPSIMDTPTNRKAMPKADHADWPKVEEVAATIVFLASPENKVTRGGLVPVYGRS